MLVPAAAGEGARLAERLSSAAGRTGLGLCATPAFHLWHPPWHPAAPLVVTALCRDSDSRPRPGLAPVCSAGRPQPRPFPAGPAPAPQAPPSLPSGPAPAGAERAAIGPGRPGRPPPPCGR